MSKVTAAEWSASNHGHDETNGLINGADYHSTVKYDRVYSLKDLELAGGKISRLRMLSDVIPGRGKVVDISYIHATLPNGDIVTVQNYLPNLIPRYRIKSYLIDWAKRERVFGKKVDLLNESHWSIL